MTQRQNRLKPERLEMFMFNGFPMAAEMCV